MSDHDFWEFIYFMYGLLLSQCHYYCHYSRPILNLGKHIVLSWYESLSSSSSVSYIKIEFLFDLNTLPFYVTSFFCSWGMNKSFRRLGKKYFLNGNVKYLQKNWKGALASSRKSKGVSSRCEQIWLGLDLLQKGFAEMQ